MERYRNAMCMVTVFVLLCSKIIPSSEAQDVPKVYMIGDSTMANKPLTPPQPERGWGQLLPVYWKHPDAIHNHAKNGRSSKSFRTEGLWSPILEKLEQGDWVVIQFGHNDEKKESPERFTDPKSTFREELRRYIDETRQKGANPSWPLQSSAVVSTARVSGSIRMATILKRFESWRRNPIRLCSISMREPKSYWYGMENHVQKCSFYGSIRISFRVCLRQRKTIRI